MVAHIRAIKQSDIVPVIHEFNCHPFNYKEYLFVHNGQISNFSENMIKLRNILDISYLKLIKGNTDSELIFYLIIQKIYTNKIINIKNIKKSVLEVIYEIITLIKDCCSLNLGLLTKQFVMATRFINNNDSPPSLYYKLIDNTLNIASEPIDADNTWKVVPDNSILIYNENELSIEKIIF